MKDYLSALVRILTNSATGRLASVGVLLLLLGGWWVFRPPTGAVQIEIADEQIKVTFGETGRTLRGMTEETLWLPIGEHVLHVQIGETTLDTPEITVAKNEPVELKFERVGNRVRVMRNKEFLVAKELPRSKAGGGKGVKADGTAMAPVDFALRFEDPKSQVTLPVLPLDSSKPFTLEAFVTPRKLGAGQGPHLVVSPGQVNFGINHKDQLYVWLYHSKGYAIVACPTRLESDKRTHVALIRQTNQVQFFVDGKLSFTEELVDLDVRRAIVPWQIGKSWANSFGDEIDEVRISKVARYAKDFTPKVRFEPDADTLALYHFDEGRGEVLKDSSGNKHHGQIVAAKWVKADGSPITPSDPDRRAAEWVLSIGGSITITENGQERPIAAVGDLPRGAFELTSVGLPHTPKVSNAGLAAFKDNKNLIAFDLGVTQVSDAGLKYFKDCKNLWHLDLSGTQVSDAGLAHLKDFQNLTTLDLCQTKVSDVGLVHFQNYKNLRGLLSSETKVTDTELAHFKDCQNLTTLYLNSTQVGDAGLAHFQNCKNLTTLALSTTQVSDEGLAHFKDCKNLTHLDLHSTQVSDAGLPHLQDCKNITFLDLSHARVSDAGLQRLADFPKLVDLRITKTKVTEAGVKKLAAALPKCKIEWDGGVIESKVVAIGAVPPMAKAPFNAKQARAHQESWAKHRSMTVETTNSVGAKMILIPPGEFRMGSSDEQVAAALKVADEIKTDAAVKGRIEKAERPQHKVVITKPFLMSATEVTIGQFKKFSATGYQTEAEKAAVPKSNLNPAVTDELPAAFITWNDAVAYCKWLSEQERANYRLPTEAEWEYACRAKTTTQYSFGDDYNEWSLPKYGWHNKNAFGQSHPVGTLLPNPFGLFDMHGNLYEWCGDYFDEKWYSTSPPNDPIGPAVGSSCVICGGNWQFHASYCRSADRNASTPSHRGTYHGFRCVREFAPPTK